MRWTTNALLAIVALGLAACAEQPVAPTEAKRIETENAAFIVQDIDVPTRRVLLSQDDGSQRIVHVSPDVQGLENVKIGDLVQVTVLEITVARLANTEEAVGVLGVVARGERDGLPARDQVSVTRRVVEVASVSRLGDTVKYRNADGSMSTVNIIDADIRAFARGLHDGDRVVIETLEKVTISTIAS